MNEGVIKEIKIEGKKTCIKINLDLKYEEKKDDKVIESYNIYICQNAGLTKFPIMIDSNMYFEVDNENICYFLNKKCIFELTEENVEKDKPEKKYKIKSITAKADD